MSKHPKVSIITITYHAELWLERTMLSVGAQDYPNKEYLIVDGKSMDGTLEIVFKHRALVTETLTERDYGIYDAMNKGIAMATGEYIVFMNAGDVFVDEHALSNIMKDAGDADFIYGKALYRDVNGETRPWHKETPPAHELNARSFLNGMVICHQCMIVRRDLVPEYDLDWSISADIDWSIKLMDIVKTKYFYDEILVYYLDGGYSGKQKPRSTKERYQICRKHFGFWPTFFYQFKIALGVIKRGRLS